LGIVSKTGQLWKFYLAFIVVGLCAFGPKLVARWFEVPFGVQIVSPFVALGAFALACFSIRCPECRANWLWDAVSSRDFRRWLEWFWTLEECPSCAQLPIRDSEDEDSIRCPRCQQMSANHSFCDVCGKDLRASPPPIVLPDNEGILEDQPNLGVAADRDPRERGSRPLNSHR
jgi:hypothetical protein